MDECGGNTSHFADRSLLGTQLFPWLRGHGERICLWGGTILLLLFSAWQAKRIDFRREQYKTYALAVLFLILNLILLIRTQDNFVSSIYLETREHQRVYADFIQAKESRGQNLTANLQITSDTENGIYVLVIGESETRDHMSAFGYNRKTTPWLDSMKNQAEMLFFPHVYANYIQTVSALTYALTAKNHCVKRCSFPYRNGQSGRLWNRMA